MKLQENIDSILTEDEAMTFRQYIDFYSSKRSMDNLDKILEKEFLSKFPKGWYSASRQLGFRKVEGGVVGKNYFTWFNNVCDTECFIDLIISAESGGRATAELGYRDLVNDQGNGIVAYGSFDINSKISDSYNKIRDNALKDLDDYMRATSFNMMRGNLTKEQKHFYMSDYKKRSDLVRALFTK